MNKELKRKRKASLKRKCKKAEIKATRAMIHDFLSMLGNEELPDERRARKEAARAVIGFDV